MLSLKIFLKSSSVHFSGLTGIELANITQQGKNNEEQRAQSSQRRLEWGDS
jgi:hypothetical protein